MLYLFGQLALSDSLFYHEDFDADDYPAAVGRTCSSTPETGAHQVAAATTAPTHASPTAQPAYPPPAGLKLAVAHCGGKTCA